MKLHRVFIAINLPDEVKDELLEYKEEWADMPAKWVAKENLHLTLAFLGNTSDKELAEVYKHMGEVGERHQPFSINFTKIVYSPLDSARGKPSEKIPRMIWAVVEKSPELSALQQDVTKTLGQASNQFSPHLTLARLKTFQLQHMETEELPDIHEEISLSFRVNSFDIMESRLKKRGPEYTILQTCPLGYNK